MSENKNQNEHPSQAQTENTADSQNKDANKQLEDLQAAAEKFKNDYLYLRADFENYKKQALKERSEYLKYGSERLLVEILNVLDNFERALETKVTPDSFNNYIKGVEMTATELKAVLKNFGISDVASKGSPFDPTMHEALGSEPTNDVPVGHVVRVFKKPYKLHDKLIRPGQVVVASKPGQN